MKKNSIAVVKQMLETEEISKELLEDLKNDERKGIQTLIERYEKKEQKKRQQLERYQQMLTFEEKAIAAGHKWVAGVDEAGRGPLAGPVTAAAVILPHDFLLPGLNDSKQLKEEERNRFYQVITEKAISYHVSVISNETIDQVNILEATKLAMQQAIAGLSPVPDHVLIDAVPLLEVPFSSEVIIKGDTRSVSIAAASILAKVTRDRIMQHMHKEYPVYDFQTNKGYGTKKHMEGLARHGVSPYHRISFAPVQQAAGK